jgi:hypothetical protein
MYLQVQQPARRATRRQVGTALAQLGDEARPERAAAAAGHVSAAVRGGGLVVALRLGGRCGPVGQPLVAEQ